eukprot:s606_g5.t1
MIPAFKPGETDVNEYSKKLEFLSGLWPQEHLSHLAPRAAMLCEGSSFKRVMRIDPSKLKVNSEDGVKLLVQTLGGIWGRSTLEDKFERFERAIYTTVQRADETHESYLARHDFQFEELLQMNVGFKEMRAYILIRNSGMNAEDKKKLIVDSKGELSYDEIVSALKLLGSKFFHEVQSGQKSSMRSKTYDVNVAVEDEWHNPEDDTAYVGEAWDETEIPYDESDPDALVCMQFEDSLVDALQGDQELALCYNAYLDARKRLTDRNKNRGFWNASKGGPSSVKGKGKGKSKNFPRYREPLSQRILRSECRRCGQRGHWKAECALNRNSSAAPASANKDSAAFTGMTMAVDSDGDDMIVVPHTETVPCQTQVVELPVQSQDINQHEHVCMTMIHKGMEAVTSQKRHEEFQSMSYEQLSQMRIAFGESKVNQKFIDVIQEDPKYVQWFVRKYAGSKKATHAPFLYFVELYVERLELTQESPTSKENKDQTKGPLLTKSKAAARKPIDLESQGSWSDSEPSKPWSVVHEENQVIQDELSIQKDRISNMENSLSQIAVQLQNLTQLAMQSQASQSH